MRRHPRWLLLALLLAACSPGGRDQDATARDSLTRRQRDSTIAASKLPNANAVGKALDASDAAAARAAQLDSIR